MIVTDSFSEDLLRYVFNRSALPAPWGTNFWASLLEAMPSGTGDQTTGETQYDGYGRVSLIRGANVFSVQNRVASNAIEIAWPPLVSGPKTFVGWALGASQTGAGRLAFALPFQDINGAPTTVTMGVTDEPRFLVDAARIFLI